MLFLSRILFLCNIFIIILSQIFNNVNKTTNETKEINNANFSTERKLSKLSFKTRRKRKIEESTPYWRLVTPMPPSSDNSSILLNDLSNIQDYIVKILEEPSLNNTEIEKIKSKNSDEFNNEDMKILISDTIGDQPTIIKNEIGSSKSSNSALRQFFRK